MRSIDVFKCWPFASTASRDVSREEVQSWLPPMALCPRSNVSSGRDANPENLPSAEEASRRTDSDEEEEEDDDYSSDGESVKSAESAESVPPPESDAAVNEDDKLEMVCPVCREFNAATLTAVNAHMDGCLAQTMRDERRHMRIMNLKSSSSKSKPPKKRSIAEIFKVKEQKSQPQSELEPEPEPEPEPQPPPEPEPEPEPQQPKLQSPPQPEVRQQEPQSSPPQIESVLKLWPLYDADEVSNTVTKFEWLSRRLEALRSTRGGVESAKSVKGDSAEEEEEKMVCPVCRDFNASTVTAVNAHIDGCLAQAVREERRQMRRTTVCKSKPKAPKKRSIAEILTVAPPIEADKKKAIRAEEDEEKSDYGFGDSTSAAPAPVVSIIKNKKSTNKSKKKKKMKKVKKKKSQVEKHGDGGVSFVNNEKKTLVSKKRKKRKRSVFNNGPTENKDDAHKRMVQTAVNSSRKLRSTIGNKMLPVDEVDTSVDGRKLGLNCLSVEKKQQVRNCNSVGKQQKAESPVHGILKSHLKLHVSQKTSSGSDVRDGTEGSPYDDQEPTSDRHVKFSGKDGILGPKKRNSFDETMFNISSDVLTSSVIKEKSSGSDEETASLERNRNYDHIAFDIDREKREEVCSLVESKQFSNTLEQVSVQSFLKPCADQEKSKLLEEKSELLTKVAVCDNNNSQLFCGGNSATLPCSPHADISRPLSAVQEEQMPGINTPVSESGSFSYSGKFDHFEAPQVDAVNSNENTKTFLEPSSSYSASYNKAIEKPDSPLPTYGDRGDSGEALGDRQFSRMLSADMIDNSFPFTGWDKGSAKNSCLDPNFFGLPLNSHGELINFSSSGNLGMNRPETSSTLRGSLIGLPINNILHQSNPDNSSINENHAVQKTFPKDGLNPFSHHPTRLAVTELQCREGEDIHRPNSDLCSSHYVPPPNSELNLKKNSFIEQNQCDQVQNHNGNGVISLKEGSDHVSLSSSQPTVRLMGKDVPIGRSSQEMQQFVGDVWTDEESRRRNYSDYAALDHPLLGRSSKQDWVSGSPVQISADNVLQSAKIQSNQASQSTILMSGTDPGFSQQFIDRQSNHVSQNGSLGVSRNASSYFNPITQKSTSYAAFNGTSGDFPAQFMPGAKPLGLSSQSLVQPTGNFSPSARISNGEPNDRNKNPHVTKSAFGFPFLQQTVNEQAKASWFQRPLRSSPSWLSSSTDEMLPGTFSQQFSGSSSQSFSQNLWGNNFTTPSVNHSAEVRWPSNHLTTLGPMQTTPISRASIVQPLHVPVTPSTINSGHRNINTVTDRLKLDDHHPCTNTRKRPAANFDDSRRPTNIQLQGNLSHMSRLTAENVSIELQRNTRALELDQQVHSARSRCCQHEAQNLNPGSYPAVNSFKLDGMVASGPVRLGPKRAKHILKSS